MKGLVWLHEAAGAVGSAIVVRIKKGFIILNTYNIECSRWLHWNAGTQYKKFVVCLNSSSGIELATSDANVLTELDFFFKIEDSKKLLKLWVKKSLTWYDIDRTQINSNLIFNSMILDLLWNTRRLKNIIK